MVSERYPLLKGMSGGDKQKWLRLHRDEVIAHYEKHGEAATMLEYRMKRNTLESFLSRKPAQTDRFTKADRALSRVEMVETAQRQINRRIDELEGTFDDFVPLVADRIAEKFLKPLIRYGIGPLPYHLEEGDKQDPLELTDLPSSGEK